MLTGPFLITWLHSILIWRNVCALPFTDSTVDNGQYPAFPQVSQCPSCPACEGIGGQFQPWGSQCNGAFHPIGMACGFQCMCCVSEPNCPVQDICVSKLGGTCIPWEQTCSGLYKKYSADNILCENGRCKCCIDKCMSFEADRQVCEKLGGECISSVKRCNGSTYPFCGQKNCKCCVDGSKNPKPESLFEHEDGSGPINSMLCVYSGTRWCGDDLTGVCRGMCLKGEKTIRGDCEGPSCRCCRPYVELQRGYSPETLPISITVGTTPIPPYGAPSGVGNMKIEYGSTVIPAETGPQARGYEKTLAPPEIGPQARAYVVTKAPADIGPHTTGSKGNVVPGIEVPYTRGYESTMVPARAVPQASDYVSTIAPEAIGLQAGGYRSTTSPAGEGPQASIYGNTMAPSGPGYNEIGPTQHPYGLGSTITYGEQNHVIEETACTRPGAHCGTNGTCKGECINGEFELMEADAVCTGPECVCCAEPSICPTPGSPCGSSGGTCLPQCPPGTAPSKQASCDGRNCKCCVACPDCEDPGEPCGIGFCRPECLPGEELTKTGSCDGSNCKCCAVPLVLGCDSPGSGCWNGICKAGCDAYEIVHREATCSGKDCYCCVIISTECGQACGDGGTCRQTCPEWEHPRVPDDCPGPACKCCVPGPDTYLEPVTVEEAKLKQRMGYETTSTISNLEPVTVEEAKLKQRMGYETTSTISSTAPVLAPSLPPVSGISVNPRGYDAFIAATRPPNAYPNTDTDVKASTYPTSGYPTSGYPTSAYPTGYYPASNPSSYDATTPSYGKEAEIVNEVPVPVDIDIPATVDNGGEQAPQVIYLPAITITVPEEVKSGEQQQQSPAYGDNGGVKITTHGEDNSGHAHDVHHTDKVCVSLGSSCGNKGGQCRERQCKQGETPDGTCYGSDCVCCVYTNDTKYYNVKWGAGESRHPRCTSRRGKSLEPLPDGTCPLCDVTLGEACGHDGHGFCKEVCEPGELQITNLCPGIACHCCMPACEKPGANCGELGAGLCAPQCQGNDQDVGTCPGEACRCCVPRVGPYCDELDSPCGEGGQCKCECGEDEVVQPGSCTGDGCRCCVRVSNCKAEGRPCGPPGSQGSCKPRCTTEELRLSDCGGMDCHCCAPKACSALGSQCGTKGVCKPACEYGEHNVGVCFGARCMCCEPIPPCTLMGAPCGSGGICTPVCNVNERIVGQCPGPMCMCCGPAPNCVAPATKCGDCGICKLECGATESVMGSCFGVDCKCCSTQPKCDGGTCKHDCGPGEESLGPCPGTTGCQCCKGGCELPGSKCRGDKAYVGDDEEGTCKPRCDIGEREIGQCPGQACVCCSAPPPDCEEVNKPCGSGGVCKALCNQAEVADPSSPCPGRSCQCCLRGKCTSDDTMCGAGGRCRTGCVPGEMVTGDSCPGYNCKCCMTAACESSGSACGPPGLGGTCKKACGYGETMSRELICRGRDCHCCIPPACLNPNSRCGLAGFCKPECGPGEITTQYTCSGVSCKCCEAPACQSEGAACGPPGSQGMCKSLCDPTEIIAHESCPGRDCRCCIPPACRAPGSPCGNGGVCKMACDAYTEVEASYSPCSGRDCKCCIHKTCFTPGSSCGNNGGVCQEACSQGEMVDKYGGHCYGASCVCCVVQPPAACDAPGSSCGAFGGVCKESCTPGVEEEPPTGSASCSGSSCKCCVAIPNCEVYDKCCYGAHGQCVPLYVPCIGPEAPNTKCGPGCHCCAPQCSGRACGHMDLGICQKSCEGDEDVIGECDVNMCKCCGGCIMNNKQCGSNGQGRCKMICSEYKDNEIEGDCPGASCKCCARKEGFEGY